MVGEGSVKQTILKVAKKKTRLNFSISGRAVKLTSNMQAGRYVGIVSLYRGWEQMSHFP